MPQTVLCGRGDCMLKKKINGTWQNISVLKKRIDGAWSDCSFAKKKTDGAWSIVWQRIFLDWIYESGIQTGGFSSYGANSFADGNIRIQAAYGSSGSAVRICTDADITMEANETLYADYSITTSGTDAFFEFYMRLASYGPSSSAVYAQSGPGYVGGTVSMTRTGSSATAPLNLFLCAGSGIGSNAAATLNITKIYNDSKIYYWNSKTIV